MGIRSTVLKTADQMDRYYIKRKNLEAYYCENQEFNGYWGGNAAKLLGLDTYLTEQAFCRLSHNLHPETGEQLTDRMRKDRRPGFDITFDVPKSVSLAYAHSKDDRIVRLVRQLVHDMMEEMERAAAARVRAGLDKSADENRTTGNFCYAELVHLTARPEGGFPDPHLHVHVVVFNLTMDPVEKKWKALQMGDIHEEIPYYQALFHKRLAEGLQALGLGIVPTRDAFEIEGISRDLIEKFSRRTKKIEDTAERLGITDPVQKAKLGAMTRERKNKSLTIPELEEFWWGGLSPDHREALEGVKARLKQSLAHELSSQMVPLAPGQSLAGKNSEGLGQYEKLKSVGPLRRQSLNMRTRPGDSVEMAQEITEYDRRAVRLAIQHVYERQSAATKRELLAEAFRGEFIAKATTSGIMQVMEQVPLLRGEINGKECFTTTEILQEERRLIEQCKAGKDRHEPLNEFWKIEDKTLNEDQRGAVHHILNSRDWVTGVAGKAGSGKTRLLTEVRRGIESGMYKIIALAPSSQAARENLRAEGFKNAETVAKLLASERMQEEARGAVWLVDEAGLLSTRQADALFALAKELDARLVLIGDTGQHYSVERGQAFELLEKHGDLSTARVSKVVRQNGGYKQFVELVAEGRIEDAFEVPDVRNNMREMDFEERKAALADDYLSAIKRGKTALVVAPTHAECNSVTETIREKLKEQKLLRESVQWDVLRNLSWSEAERSAFGQYKNKKGLVIQFNDHVKGFSLGERVEVLDVRDEVVRVRTGPSYDSGIKALPLHEFKKFNVYERDQMEICAGEEIRITANSRTLQGERLNNGKQYTVDYIDPQGRLVLENGWRLDKSFPHLAYAYASTSQSAQGLTVDCVYVAQSAQFSTAASDMKQFYVSVTRGREEVKIYTDDIELLMEKVSRVRKRPMATEILRGGGQQRREATVEKTSATFGEWHAVETGLHWENPAPDNTTAKTSAKVGKYDAQQLTKEISAEVERMRRENNERQLRRAKQMSMGMGM